MQLSTQGIAVIKQLKQNIIIFKSNEGVKHFIAPSIDIFYASIPSEIKEQLRKKLVVSGTKEGVYVQVIEAYKAAQIKYLFDCIDSVGEFLNQFLTNNKMPDLFMHIFNFIEYEQLSTIADSVQPSIFDLLNPAVKFRLIYFLIDQMCTSIACLKKETHFSSVQEPDNDILKKIETIAAHFQQNMDRKQQLNPLFYSELHIREASTLASGELVRSDHLSDIFIVYKKASFGSVNIFQQDYIASYYNLAVRTLLQLTEAAKKMPAHQAGQQLSVIVSPINHETSIGHYGVVSRSVFGVTVSYHDMQFMDVDTCSPGFNHVYQIDTPFRLDSHIKIAYLQHINELILQMKNNPKHSHHQRRVEKLNALESIVKSDDEGSLSPTKLSEVKKDKPNLFAAWKSKTQALIENTEEKLKAHLWQKLASEKDCIGKDGYAITDEALVEQLKDKYLILSKGATYNVNQRITDLLRTNPDRADYSGHDLWRFDKKMALEIILIAHAQQRLHPALIRIVEEKYPMLFMRSFHLIKKSEVEILLKEVKKDIMLLLWNNAANETDYNSYTNARINNG